MATNVLERTRPLDSEGTRYRSELKTLAGGGSSIPPETPRTGLARPGPCPECGAPMYVIDGLTLVCFNCDHTMDVNT